MKRTLRMKQIISIFIFLISFGFVNGQTQITVSPTTKQQMRFGIDAERLWFWRSSLKSELAELAVKELQSDYVRVAINCAYEREQGVKNPAAYDQILEMMTAMKAANPQIKFFASPRPLDEAYTPTEELAIFGAEDGCPWAPYPGWIMGFSGFGGIFGSDGFNKDEALQYLVDYLNFMDQKGFQIDYLDLTNEKNVITPGITKYMYNCMPAMLNPTVKMPAFVVPSTWSRQQGIDWLKSVNKTANEHLAFEIAGTHNTDPAGTPEAFVTEAKKLNKEVWNTELHGWTGIALRDEVLNSNYLWEHIRAGFSGIDSWLFFGPLIGKDHTMIWASTTQIVKSGKYEMFKKLVNNANRGYYLETTMPNSNCMTASFIKDTVLTIWTLNKATAPLNNVKFVIQNKNIQNKSIEITKWNSKLSRQGTASQITALNADNFTHTLDSASLYCFKITFPTATSIPVTKVEENSSIYPNPASTYFTIKTMAQPAAIELLTADGRWIKSFDIRDKAFEISDSRKGIYLVRIVENNHSYLRKLVID